MNEDDNSFLKNGAWVLVPRPMQKNVISSKWLYKIKIEVLNDSSVGILHKARMVAQCFSQIRGMNYLETFAPVGKLTSIEVLLIIVASKNVKLDQRDLFTAFLNRDLKKDVYMEHQLGFEKGDPAKVGFKLIKSVCGLKQVSQEWYAKFDAFSVDTLRIYLNKANRYIYIRQDHRGIFIIVLYVDHLWITYEQDLEMTKSKEQLRCRFKTEDLRESRLVIGMEIFRNLDSKTVFLVA